MKRESDASRILDVLSRTGVPLRTDQIAEALGETVSDVATELAKLYRQNRVLRFGERGNSATGARREWALPLRAVPTPSNVVPLRQAKAPLRMLPVIRRDDCVHEPECSMAATKKSIDGEWKRDTTGRAVEGLTCPWVCEDYRRGPRRHAPHPSNWMGGEG